MKTRLGIHVCSRTVRFAVTLSFLLVGFIVAIPNASPGHAQQELSRRPRLLVIHGRAETTNDPKGLAAEWMHALNLGLHTALGDSLFIPLRDRGFVYYGDVFRETDPDWHPRCPLAVRRRKALYARDPIDAEEQKESGENVGLRFARALTTFMPQSWRYNIIMPFTRDTRDYIHEGLPSCSVRNILHDSITSDTTRPLVILAHSQGALLTYEYLANAEGWRQIAGLVSAGSQFGFDQLMLRFGGKQGANGSRFRTPSGIRMWYNIYDAKDPVAFPMANSRRHSRYRPDSALVWLRELRIRNPKRSRHDATGYLAHPTTAIAVAHAWCRALAEQPRRSGRCFDVEHAARSLTSDPRRPVDWVDVASLPVRLVPLIGYGLIARQTVD